MTLVSRVQLFHHFTYQPGNSEVSWAGSIHEPKTHIMKSPDTRCCRATAAAGHRKCR